jgi:VWFA-related protein
MNRIAACSAFLFAGAFALAQTPSAPTPAPASVPSPDDRPLVLSAVVSDSHGNRIASLVPADFQVVVQGKAAPVAKVVEMHAVTDAATGAHASQPRRIVVLFDTPSLSLAGRRTASDAVKPFLARALRPGDRVLIISASQSLRALTPTWTSDPALIDRALEQLGGESSVEMAGEREAAQRRIEQMISDIRAATQPGHANAGTFFNFDTLVQAGRDYANIARRDSLQAVSLYTTALDLFPSGGTKNVLIVVGGGLSSRPGADIFVYLESLKSQGQRGELGPALAARASTASPLTEISSFDISKTVKELGADAWRRGIAVYALDSQLSGNSGSSGSVESSARRDSTVEFAGRVNRSEGYILLSDESGGLPLLGRRPADAFDEVKKDLDSYYAITLLPGAVPPSRHAVDLRAKGGQRVRFTVGGGPSTPEEQVQSEVVAHHVVPPDSNDLGISIDSAAPVAEGVKRRVSLKVKIPIRNLRLVEESGALTGGFNVYITTGDAGGRTSRITKQTHHIKWPPDALSKIGDREIIYAFDVVLEPGRTQVSIGVLDEKSGKTGYQMVTSL